MIKRSVGIEKTKLTFNASHLLVTTSFNEPLHGHNYYIEVEIHGDKSDEGLILDFLQLEDYCTEICGRLDHYVLMPSKNPLIDIKKKNGNYFFTIESETYSFPCSEVKLLEYVNITAENLCDNFLSSLKEYLNADDSFTRISEISVTLWEGLFYWTRCTEIL